MEAAPVGKLWVRDPQSGEVSLVDADPVTVDLSAFLSGLSDASDPSSPVPFSGDDVEDAEPAEDAEVEAEVEAEDEESVEVEADEADEEDEAVEEFTPAPGFEAPKPAPAKRGRPKKATQ